MKIKMKASTMVKPATATPTTAIWISNLDNIMPEKLHIPEIYGYRSTGADDFFDPVALKASLSQALVEFYPLAGRLRRDVNGRIEIDCNGKGAFFAEAECDGALADFGDFILPEINLVPPVDYSGGISTYPLLLVQVTRFSCGGVTFGFAAEHHATDRYSIDHFLNTWAEISSGRDITTRPFFDRRLLAARNPPQPQFPHIEYLPPPTLRNSKENPNATEAGNETTSFSIFKLTRDQLNALKAKSQEDEGSTVKYTTYQSLAGHIWRCTTKARKLPKDQETKLYIPMEGRTRLQPPLPAGYFGNVVGRVAATAFCGEVESNPLKFSVGKIHEAMAEMGGDYLRSAIDYLEVHAGGTASYKCPNLGVVSWASLVFSEQILDGVPLYV